MAKKSNKSALVSEYLQKYPDMGTTELISLIAKEKKVKVSTSLVSTARRAAASGEATKPAAKSTTAKAPPAKAAAAALRPGKGVSISEHVANLQAAVQALGKDQAKNILDLF